jgi:hypothetical protein
MATTTTFIGSIQSIDLKPQTSGCHKKVVTLKMAEQQRCFIEFRSRAMMAAISKYEVNNFVEIEATMEGNISKSTGVEFNNIIAKKISNK